MSWLKSGLNFVGGLFGGKSSGMSMPVNSAIMANPLSFNSSGLPPGISSGNINDGFVIDAVSVPPPNTKKTGGSTSNWFDKTIAGIGAASGLIGAIKGSGTTNSVSSGTDSGNNKISERVNEFLKDSTKDVSIQTGLDKNTKIFLGVAGGAALLYFMFK